MVLNDVGNANQRVRDELGSQPSVQQYTVAKTENLKVEEAVQQSIKQDIGNAWVIGHPVNGVIGTPALGIGGGQIVVGVAAKAGTSLAVVRSPLNTYVERFYLNTFIDTGTGSYSINNDTGTASLATGSAIQSKIVFTDNNEVVRNATLFPTQSIGTVDYSMSADSGNTFESVTADTFHTFSTTGTALIWKATGSASYSEISQIRIRYNE